MLVYQDLETNGTQVNKSISSLKSSNCRDYFYFDTIFVKCNDILTPLITHLLNLSMKHSSFPDDWKCAVITPTFKSGDCLEVCDCRPISIDCQYSQKSLKSCY